MKVLRGVPALCGVLWLLTVGAAPAVAAPQMTVEMTHAPTRFQVGEPGELWFAVSNLGNEANSSPVTLSVDLPPGITRDFVFENGWSCPGAPGDSTVTCTSEREFLRHSVTYGTTSGSLVIGVDVSPELEGSTTSIHASIEGSGSPLPSTDTETVVVGGPHTFGIAPDSFMVKFLREDGVTEEREAASHPDLATFAFDLNNGPAPYPGESPLVPSIPNFKAPVDHLRNLRLELPPGFVADPSAVTECPLKRLPLGSLLGPACPPSSQVGRVDVGIEYLGGTTAETLIGAESLPVYNLVHPPGTAAELGFELAENLILVKAELDPSNGYAIKTSVANVPEHLLIFSQKLTLWGVPAAAEHNSERCETIIREAARECSPEKQPEPYLTLPARCGDPGAARLFEYDSYEHPGVFGSDVESEPTPQLTSCDSLSFAPEISSTTTTSAANSPVGLTVSLRVPQNNGPSQRATPPVKDIEVTLPEGMALSPAASAGLSSCDESQIGLGTNSPATCPDSSRLGEVSLTSPLLNQDLDGTVYLAAQKENPFGSTFAIYLALHDTEQRGILIKQAGKLNLDPATGRITTEFTNLPQLPFEEVTLRLRSGNRAPLVNSPLCGRGTVEAQVSSWAQPSNPVRTDSAVGVDGGPDGSPCVADGGARPFGPGFSAGTINPTAGRYSPFVLRVTRSDAEQDLSRIEAVLPEGLLAKIADLSYCPEEALGAVGLLEGTGASQSTAPSCPANSRLGSVDAGVGSGFEPNFFSGAVYLAGPYKGAPLSLAILIPAVAGPFDLGNVLVRAGVFVDPTTAQVRTVSDPLPTIVDGVPLHQRDIRFRIDRPETTINPTNCEPMAVRGSATSTDGAKAQLAERFQVGDCNRLGFSPKLAISFGGSTQRLAHPKVKAVLRQKPGQANLRNATVIMPPSEFIDQAHVTTPCTRPQFAAGSCPPKSILGYARAWTPLLAKPLEGPVYFRSNGGERELPDLVAALHGQFDVNLVGFIDSVRRKGSEISRVRTRFANIPDAPVTKFVLQLHGGKRGLLQNTSNLCRARHRVQIHLAAQNAMRKSTNPALKLSCGKRGKRK